MLFSSNVVVVKTKTVKLLLTVNSVLTAVIKTLKFTKNALIFVDSGSYKFLAVAILG